ncbi:hypothetical protein [Leptospira semungkisensis]|nr:hypothetical protein [Leptospira semungkisensis]
MTLGSSIISPRRMLFRQIAFFAQWENESSLDYFLTNHNFGKILAKSWHTRLELVRQWGSLSGLKTSNLEMNNEKLATDSVVVAVTIARMKFFQIPRFIHWGKPVEKLVRDHPGKIFALASIRLPNTVSTFTIWKSVKEMTDMVNGLSNIPQPKRHIDAMKERERKDFHFEFVTLRFKPLSEVGKWMGNEVIFSNRHLI